MAQCFGIVACYISHKREIQIFLEVTVFDSTFGSRRLVLVRVILKGFSESHGRQPRLIKRIMITASSVAIDTENQAYSVLTIDFFYSPGQFARRRIAIFDIAAAREQPHMMRSARGRVRTHDIVVQHPPTL